ncbi:MAG: hypothetical protein R3C14_19475 [Caldilineaceae bacterium]
MILSYAHSRAAILCFGGWGLQVMFHLLPRLQAAQEQRAALSNVPTDLGRLTSFAALLPEPLINTGQHAQFYARQPRLDQSVPPFYIEKLLERLGRDLARTFDEQTAGILTAAEKHGHLLLNAAEPMLTPLTIPGRGFYAAANGLAPSNGSQSRNGAVRRATRQEIFRTALTHAEPMARLLETHLIDPIRQDALLEEDPFVQTTLYVIAPLFEPLTSALIWPTVAQLMARIGHRHVAQVVGLFATGSYATDMTRPVEDAAAYAALAELELLTGVQAQATAAVPAAIHTMVSESAPFMTDLIGQPLFDYLYLVDREKSNQGLAQSSHEVAVVASNALEALIVAGGNLYIQEQLGVGVHGGDGRAYSLIGAAGDYVPIAQLLQSVNRQEESRLVREWVLRNSDANVETDIDANTNAALAAALTPAGESVATFTTFDLQSEKVIAQLAPHLTDLLAQKDATTVEALAVADDFVLPKPIAQQLRRVRAEQWQDAFQAHVNQLEKYLQLAVGANYLDDAWGIQAVQAGHEWFLYEVDDRLLPATVSRMQAQLLKLLAASPAGLTRAQIQTQRWLREIEQVRQRLYTVATPSARHLARVQRLLGLRNWELKYTQAAATTPSFWAIMARAGVATLLVAFLSLIYLLIMQRSWEQSRDTLSLLGFAVGIFVAGVATYRVTQERVRTLRRERVALAQNALTAQLREATSDGLVRAYDRLLELLNYWNRMLAEAASELTTLSTPPSIPVVPPPGVPLMPLYQPHLNQALWDRCLAYLRAQQDTQGRRSEERLERIWGVAQWHSEMKRILSSAKRQEGQSQARTIAQFIRDTVRESVAPVNLEQTNAVRAELIRELAQEFSIEHLLWRGALEEQEFNRRLRMIELGLLSTTPQEKNDGAPVRRYVEHVWHRAKPTANYEVSDRLAVYGMSVEFVAASGDPASELTRTLLDEFNLTLLPTGNPFTILFVRSVHGLGLGDLESVRRYQTELGYLSAAERRLVLLDDTLHESLYQRPLQVRAKERLAQRYASPAR